MCDTIDWTALIKSLENQKPAYVGPRHDVGDPVPGVDEVVGNLRKAGYTHGLDGGSASWDMFLPFTNFSEEIALEFAAWAGLDGYTNCWISRILPGYMAPWHWDVTDDENTLKYENHVRYHVNIGEYDPAHVFIIEDVCLHGQPQGATWKWPSRTSYHCGMNGGLSAKYLFNFWHKI